MEVKITPEEDRDQAMMFSLLSSCTHGDGEEILSLMDHMQSAIHFAPKGTSVDLSSLKGENVNPFPSYEFQSKSEKNRFAMIWPKYNPAHTMEVTILGCQGALENRCSIVNASHQDKQFAFFSPSDPQAYSSYIGKKKEIKIAAIGTSVLYGLFSAEEPAVVWFEADELDQIRKNGFSRVGRTDFVYQSIFTHPQLKKQQGDYFIFETSNPLDTKNSLELLAWGEEHDPYPQPLQIPNEIGAKFYFLGVLK